MKKRSLGISLLLTGFALTLGAFLVPSNNPSESNASSYSVTSVPTTIDLNDTTAANIRSYYSSLSSLGTAERQGTNLLKNLKPILKNNQKYYSYGSSATTAVWQCYEIVDRDWDKSPATSISGYNSSTNKITGYVYGTSNSNVGSNPYIHALYVNRNVTNQTRAWGNHNQDQWGINQEHVWAKSWGFNDNSPAAGARGDLMHLWAGNGKVNGTYHSNYYYGYVDKTQSYDNASDYASTLSGNLKGKSKSLGGSYTVFEPQDSDKGDIARALFYMAARYNYLSGSDSDGIDAGNPNLEIVNVLNPGSSYQSTTSKKGQMGILQDLLEWNRIDPPDEWEIHRNNLLYNNFTKNRNPFIDFPEWAEFIWGKCTDGSYSSTSTGYATPASDNINTFSGGSSVSVTGVTLNKNSTSLITGDTEALTATVSPSNATNKTVTWTSSKTSVATVNSSGLVTAVGTGSATITVKTNDGNKTATCTVTVTAPTKTLSSISLSGDYKTSFDVGDEFSFGGTVTANFSDSTSSNVTNSATFSGFDGSSAGTQTITVSYTYAGTTKTATYDVTVAASSTNTEEGGADPDDVTSSWTISGTDTYNDGSIKFDGSGDVIYKLDIFSGDVSTYMTNLVVTINGKINGTPGSANSYKVEAISGTGNNIVSKANDQKTGSSVYTTTYSNVDFEMSSNLSGTTGIRITYVTKGSGNWGIKSISWVATYENEVVDPTSISATVSKSYYVGETITKSDITVTDNLGHSITDFEFDDYTFVYEDTPGGGDNSYEMDFDIVYESLETTLNVQVQRKERVTPSGADYSVSYTDLPTSYQTSTTERTAASGVKFIAYNLANYSSKMQFKASGGYFQTTESMSLKTLTINNRETNALTVYGSTNGTTFSQTITGSNDVYDLTGYSFVKVMKSGSGAAYCASLTITVEGGDTAVNLANYVMYEDADNQCSTKFDVAKGYFEGLSKAERSTFMTSSGYVISTARTRLEAWARNQGKSIANVNGDYVVSAQQNPIAVMSINNNSNVIIIVVASVIMIAAVGGYFYIRRLKQK